MAIQDRRHHNLVLLKLANNNDIESVKEYLKTLVEKDSASIGESNYCQNTTINTVLSVYEKKAKDAGITVKIAARAGQNIPVSPQDLVIVIANIFENAINATKKLKSKDKVIDIDIREKQTRLLVKIENPCKTNLRFDETDYGIGISSVIAATEKYQGMYDFTAEDGIFSSKVCLNY
jgi:sensor histidine kinase regulating citrate/malate metabolism